MITWHESFRKETENSPIHMGISLTFTDCVFTKSDYRYGKVWYSRV